ncbi:DYW domain containing protein [Parasponia andersonii]|uniref:DYW domain containing protein n=1 Tax=Parasponia andersonii TaxID=3476 RepID=A0A2P5DR04_PARAD|nr:DYW domain containing protein [Parasponia andersonii]
MYTRCESLELACSIFSELSTEDVVIWNSIIAACTHSRQGVSALNMLRDKSLVNVNPDVVTMISVLPVCSRFAALTQGKEIHQFIVRHGLDTGSFVWNALLDIWEEAARIRRLMKEWGVTKSPGCSWIEVKRKVHSFIAGDTSHPLMKDISMKMESLYVRIKKLLRISGDCHTSAKYISKVEEREIITRDN